MKKTLLIIIPLLLTVLLSAYVMPSVTANRPAPADLAQTTPLPTIVPPVGTSVSTVVVVPVTGDETDTSTLLFYGILVLAGIAFLIMLFALMRRPHDHL